MKDSKEKKIKNQPEKDMTKVPLKEFMDGIAEEMVENLRRNTFKDGIDVPQKETPKKEKEITKKTK